jgi:predicted membrane-bound mannosyltransferase
MAPFLWIWRLDPTGPSVMVALFGIATIFLLYKVVKGMFGQLPAFIASSIYAISPVVISQSRSSWNPNVVPFFSLLLIYLLYHAVENRKPKGDWYTAALFIFILICGYGCLVSYLLENQKRYPSVRLRYSRNHHRHFSILGI